MKNPCLGCVLKEFSKNNPKCRDCMKRLEYVYAIGSMSCSLCPSVRLEGDGGFEMKTLAPPRYVYPVKVKEGKRMRR